MSATIITLQKLFERDLELLAQEIQLYPSEDSLWRTDGDIKNSGGNLCLHLCGNLQHFIGTVLGKTNYKRNREAEFRDKNIPKTKLVTEIMTTRQVISATLAAMDPSQLDEIYPINVFGESMTTNYFLIHLHSHLTYHRGQINYHRRLL